FELDVDLSAPADVSGVEDGNGDDGSGVTVDLGIVVAATDLDGSEDSTTVEIVFTDLPAGALFSGGSFDAASATWTGSMDEANALSLFLPGDYSGTVTSVIAALSPEGQAQTSQTITITPAGDIDFAVTELTTAETDAVVTVIPSTAWQVSVSDFDPGQPAETLDSVTLTLNGLPTGVTVSGVPAGSVTYDAAAGGTLVFTGSAAEYAALELGFPADYSTESPDADGLTIDGTLAATSTEDATGQSTLVTLRITPEGDLFIDDTLPDTVPDETDAPTLVIPSNLLEPVLTDVDGSESLRGFSLVVTGLPAGSTVASLGVVVPAGARAEATAQADGTVTLLIAVGNAGGTDPLAAYDALQLTLPTDFSTANRSDLTNGTSQPLELTLTALSDEDAAPGLDTPVDGEATVSRTVDIGFELDVDLSAPADVSGVEDGNGDDGSGVTVDLGIVVAATDLDGSEDST
ncbi:MAG: hypothetical protein ABJH75_18190, partial [Roseibium sp.]|uniref:hypothetical protein n=1 Tax=Roseibium sp. TaxID=1936156 RepID=UPI003298C549